MSLIRLEAENYTQFSDRSSGNAGGLGDRNDDVDIGYSNRNLGVGWIEAGEWLSYDLVIPESGNYKITGLIASAYDRNFGFKASISGQSLTAKFTGTEAWTNWKDIEAEGLFALQSGAYALRVDMLSSGFNLDKIDLERVSGINSDTGNSAVSLPTIDSIEETAAINDSQTSNVEESPTQTILIEAEDYTGFFDRSPSNLGGKGDRNDAVDIGGASGLYNVGWIEAGEWLTYDVNIAKAGQYRFTSSVASARNGRFGLTASSNGQSSNVTFGTTGGWSNWQPAQGEALFDFAVGRHSIRLDMASNSFNLDHFSLEWVADSTGEITGNESASTNESGGNTTVSDSNAGVVENSTEAPTLVDSATEGSDDGLEQISPQVITVEAEDYDRFYDRSAGNNGNAYRTDDVDIRGTAGQYNVAWINRKEWLTYEIEVPETGIYRLDAVTASRRDQTFQIDASSAGESVSLTFGGTRGWSNWQDVTADEGLALEAGRHELRLDMVTGGFNLDRVSLTKLADENNVAPTLSHQRIQAELYQAALDRSPGNYGEGSSPNENVDLIGNSIGWIEPDEWLSYEVDVPRSGTYQISSRVASPAESVHSFQAVLGGQSTLVEFGSTGGWDVEVDVEGDRNLTLEAGKQTLRVNILSGVFNLDYFDLTEVATPSVVLEGTPADVSLDLGNIVNGSQASGSADTLNYGAVEAAVQVDLSQNLQVTRPRASAANLRTVLTLGDSLTEGFLPSDLGGYRDDLWTLLNQGGYQVDFVGNRSKGIGSFDRDHAGTNGKRIDEIALRTPGLLNTYRPDAVLLMGGTNDITQGDGAATAYARLDSLVDSIFAQSSNTQLFLAAIPLTTSVYLNQAVQQFNGLVRNLVTEHQASGKSIAFVDVPNKLGVEDLEDNTHPTVEGNGKLASAWYEAWQQTYGVSPAAVSAGLAVSDVTNLLGSGFDDVLVGNAQDNIIQGGKGHDRLTGGSGRDRFILAPNSGTDTITDFTLGQDLLLLDSGLTYGEVDVVSSGTFGYSDTSNAVVLDGHGQQLALLMGVDASQVGASSFGIVV